MKTYSHDYSNAAKANFYVFEALESLRMERYEDAAQYLREARNLLDCYLASDNMLPDDDLADGWVKHSEAKAAVKESLNMYFESMKKIEEANEYLAEHESDF